MATPADVRQFPLGDLALQSGGTLPAAWMTYAVHGELSPARDNLVLYPTSYGAQHGDIDWLIGEGRILDPTRYCIVICNKLGNGQSTSPSNVADPIARGRWPRVTHWDNVHAQARIVSEVFGVERLAMIYGWSMGAQQAYHWGALFPERVPRILAICGSTRTAIHNRVFLEGVRAALHADPAWTGTHFAWKPERGLRAMGRIYAGWALSQAFYRERLHETLGFSSLEDFLVRSWEGNFLRRDADDLLAMLDTWIASDISANERFHGDLDAACAAIAARTIVMPGQTDLYFTPEDAQADAARMPNAEYRPIPSIWGHRAGNPAQSPADQAFIATAVRDLLPDM